MANKELTARVKLNTRDAEAKLERLHKLITNINKAVTGHANTSQLEKSLTKQVMQAEKAKQATLKTAQHQEKLKQAVSKTAQQIGKEHIAETKVQGAIIKNQIAEQRLATEKQRTALATERVKNAQNAVKRSAEQTNREYSKSSSLLGGIGSKLKHLASMYLGIMGTKAAISTSDTVTKAQNKLNNLNGGDESLTQLQMDIMYASANKVRMSYKDMLNNASKSMTLAGDAFQGNINNAIRFQEIMAEAYTLGGASSQEMSTSMYQMIQALGAGILAGDELRSVREGAPLAYKAIEKFAQGVYGSTESLKEMASQGLITSEMVVAAIMDSGEKMDEQFEKTYMTFEQAWDRIKNAAVKAFEPVSNSLRDMLNQAVENGTFEKIEQAFWKLSTSIQTIFTVIKNSIAWIADNWNWLKYIVIFAISAIIIYLSYMAYQSIVTAIKTVIAWAMVNASMLATIGILAGVVVALVWVANNSANVCDFIYQVCQMLAYGIVALLLVVLTVYLATGAIMLSVPTIIALLVITVILTILSVFVKFTGEIVGGIYGIGEVIGAVCQNIGVFFNNVWYGAKSAFWGFIGDVLSGLSSLEPAFNAIAKLFGLGNVSISGLSDAAYSKQADANAKIKNYTDVGDAWNRGYSKGYSKGEAIQNEINSWGEKLKGLTGNGLGNLTNGFPSATNPAYDTAGAYNMPENLKQTADNTGKMADSMELAEEDLEYLRRLADMEWKKEFTTATINVDMSNYNTINGDSDLDGIVTKLSDKLYEELAMLPNGVYV